MKPLILKSVRASESDHPVQVCEDEVTGRLVIRGVNEGGFACVDIDLRDVASWLGVDPDPLELAIRSGRYPR